MEESHPALSLFFNSQEANIAESQFQLLVTKFIRFEVVNRVSLFGLIFLAR